MHQSFTYLIITSLLIENSIKGQEEITGIWDDDFAEDWNAQNGWKIYNNQNVTDNLYNPYVIGNNGLKYHGRFTKKNAGESGKYNFMIRQFKCSQGAHVKIRYWYTFCRTEPSDKLYLYNLNAGWGSNITRTDVLGGNDCGCIDFDNYETGNTWENNLPVGSSYPGGAHAICNSTGGFRYKSTGWTNMGWQNAQTTYNVTIANKISSFDESLYIFNFQIWCDGPTVSPTQSPAYASTKNPTRSPSRYPTLNPSRYPSINPSIYPSLNPSIYPSLNPSIYPSINPSIYPSLNPSIYPSFNPSIYPSLNPSIYPSLNPSVYPSFDPTKIPSNDPTLNPINDPKPNPTSHPSRNPTIKDQEGSVSDTTLDIQSNNDDKKFAGDEKGSNSVVWLIVSVIVVTCILFCGVLWFYRSKKKNNLKTEKNNVQITKVGNAKNNNNELKQNSDEDIVNVINKTDSGIAFSKVKTCSISFDETWGNTNMNINMSTDDNNDDILHTTNKTHDERSVDKQLAEPMDINATVGKNEDIGDEFVVNGDSEDENIIGSTKTATPYVDNNVTEIAPNIEKYKEWKIKEMLEWIRSLESGRFNKYLTVLQQGFISDGIDGGDCLPDLSVAMLRDKPFNITNFRDRRDLANHFTSLESQQISDNIDNLNDEGEMTKYHNH